jgi:hypothetical protein
MSAETDTIKEEMLDVIDDLKNLAVGQVNWTSETVCGALCGMCFEYLIDKGLRATMPNRFEIDVVQSDSSIAKVVFREIPEFDGAHVFCVVGRTLCHYALVGADVQYINPINYDNSG